MTGRRRRTAARRAVARPVAGGLPRPVEPADASGQPGRPRQGRIGRRIRAAGDDSTTGQPARSSRRRWARYGDGSRPVTTTTVVPGRIVRMIGREQLLERGRRMGRQPGEQVEDPLQLARRLGRREHREPLLGAVVAGRGEPERPPAPRPSDRARDAATTNSDSTSSSSPDRLPEPARAGSGRRARSGPRGRATARTA